MDRDEPDYTDDGLLYYPNGEDDYDVEQPEPPEPEIPIRPDPEEAPF